METVMQMTDLSESEIEKLSLSLTITSWSKRGF